MKIKRFNESEERTAKEVRGWEFIEKRKLHKMEKFTESEKSRILQILKERQKHKDFRFSFNQDFLEIFGRNLVEVVKLSDYWFTIIRTDRWGANTQYFICDDIDELFNWLMKEYY